MIDTRSLQDAIHRAFGGAAAFDAYTRHVYATDASMYAIEPIGVAFPHDADEVVAAVEIAGQHGVPVLARGAGTSLGGQAVGRALVLDFSRHMHRILDVDPEAGTARVEPGVVQDDLNRMVGPHGLLFAPDTSTSNRATLGGMIGNNSCGARSARYGMTIDHVSALEVVLSDGARMRTAPATPEDVRGRARVDTLEGRLYRELPALIDAHASAIRTGFPVHWRRSGGYRLERMLPERGLFDLAQLITGSEGTLAIVTGATVKLVQPPRHVAALAGHFESVAGALATMDDLLDAGPAVIELVDRVILELARRSPLHAQLTSVLEGRPGALLWVEFYGESSGDAQAAAERLAGRWLGRGAYAVVRAHGAVEQRRFRALRQAGLGLLYAAAQGRERSLAFVEDTAVDPRRLAEYTARFDEILTRRGLRAGFYGHASAGCLHIRPFMDLTRPGAVETVRAIAQEVRDLVIEFGGVNSSEHGDGLVRSEFNRQLFGDELYGAMQQVKALFDPHGRLNPGKIVDAPRMNEHLRDPALPQVVPLRTFVRFDAEGGMRGAADRCMRVGECRKTAGAGGTMCPSWMATRDEKHSTRGRANALVLALSSPDPRAALGDAGLHEALDLCLECKACRTECPLGVDMAALKAEMLAQTYAGRVPPLRSRAFGRVRTIHRAGSALAPVSNWLARARPLRALAHRWLGIDRRRALPRFHRHTLQKWFARRTASSGSAPKRGTVTMLADSFTSYTEPAIGRAAVELLELAGWQVELTGDLCCGRALISKGLLAEARSGHDALVRRLAPAARAGRPIVGVEPSCVVTLIDELPKLASDADGAAAIAGRAMLVDELLAAALADGSLAIDAGAPTDGPPILFHAHCHQKSAHRAAASAMILERIRPGRVQELDAGCCGMAGSFGYEREHYDLSMQIGALRLFPAIRASPLDAAIAATGISCRQQIAHGTGRAAVSPDQYAPGSDQGAVKHYNTRGGIRDGLWWWNVGNGVVFTQERPMKGRNCLVLLSALVLAGFTDGVAARPTAPARAMMAQAERLGLADSMAAWYGLGIAAHHLCAGLWVVGRDLTRTPETVIAEDVARFSAFRWRDAYRYRIDEQRRTATVIDSTVGSRSAKYSGDQGCAILPAGAEDVFFTPVRVPPALPDPAQQEWPTGDRNGHAKFDDVDGAALEAALAWAFSDESLPRPQNTRGIVLLHRGRIIAERYAPGWGPYTPQISWSMGKSIAATLTGVLIQQGALRLDQPAPLEEWQDALDPRHAIRIADLLNMSSGLDFDNFGLDPDESYNAANEHFRIYFDALDVFAHAVNQPLRFPPGTVQRYRNSDPLSLMAIARRIVEARGENFLTFPQRSLFDRIGARSMVLETDAWGNFIITGYDFGGTRDWARLGLLYLRDGVWEGERILPPGFAKFVSTPAPGDPSRGYGGLFWLNRGGSRDRLPGDAYWMAGYMGQTTMIIPSRDLVVVRHGPSPGGDAGYFQEFVVRVLAALPAPGTEARH